MSAEQYLEHLRRQYQNISLPSYLVENGWNQLRLKLPIQERPQRNYFITKTIALVLLFILAAGGALGKAQAAKPDDWLYPVKLFSDNALAVISGKPEIKIERRAKDIINLSQDSPDEVERAAQEYSKALQEIQQKNNSPQKQKKLANTLNKQEERLKQTLKKLPPSEEKVGKVLQKAILETKQATGAVQGAKSAEKTPPGKLLPKNNQGSAP